MNSNMLKYNINLQNRSVDMLDLDVKFVANMIGQCLISSVKGTTLAECSPEVLDMIACNLGGIKITNKGYYSNKPMNIVKEGQLKRFIKDLQAQSQIPMIVGIDMFEHERNIGLPDSFNLPILSPSARMKRGYMLSRRDYREITEKLEKLGFNFAFDVPLSCHRSKDNDKPYSSDPTKVQLMARNVIQSVADSSTNLTICAKHFGYKVRQKDQQIDFVKYLHENNAPLDAIQVSSGADSLARSRLINRESYDELREKSGFSGLLLSADYAIERILRPDDFSEFFYLSMLSGVNMLVMTHEHMATIKEMPKLIESIAQNIIDDYYGTYDDWCTDLSDEDWQEAEINPEDYFSEYTGCAYFKLVESYKKVLEFKVNKGIIKEKFVGDFLKQAK